MRAKEVKTVFGHDPLAGGKLKRASSIEISCPDGDFQSRLIVRNEAGFITGTTDSFGIRLDGVNNTVSYKEVRRRYDLSTGKWFYKEEQHRNYNGNVMKTIVRKDKGSGFVETREAQECKENGQKVHSFIREFNKDGDVLSIVETFFSEDEANNASRMITIVWDPKIRKVVKREDVDYHATGKPKSKTTEVGDNYFRTDYFDEDGILTSRHTKSLQ